MLNRAQFKLLIFFLLSFPVEEKRVFCYEPERKIPDDHNPLPSLHKLNSAQSSHLASPFTLRDERVQSFVREDSVLRASFTHPRVGKAVRWDNCVVTDTCNR